MKNQKIMRAIARLLTILICMVSFVGFSSNTTTTDPSQNSKDAFFKVDKAIDKVLVVDLIEVDNIKVIDVGKLKTNIIYLSTNKNINCFKDLKMVIDVGKSNIELNNTLTKFHHSNTHRKARDSLNYVL